MKKNEPVPQWVKNMQKNPATLNKQELVELVSEMKGLLIFSQQNKQGQEVFIKMLSAMVVEIVTAKDEELPALVADIRGQYLKKNADGQLFLAFLAQDSNANAGGPVETIH